ncbi:CBN-NFT-1 protein [Aphelenchoides avenae]|nr:CBN-NFT-1 protein [Aphelenchus avenae]
MARRNMIAVCQLTSRHDLQENFQVCLSMIERAKKRDCKFVFLPECFDYVGRSKEESISLAMPEYGEYIGKSRTVPSLPLNTHLIIDNNGETRGRYHKLHLFDLDIPDKVRLMESEFSTGGKELVHPVDTPVGKIGPAICYDVRFPELSLWYRYKGAQILAYPSAFTLNTGLAHWETLMRCRAIETQCYVVSAAQTGKHTPNRISYGHSMVVDPWGAVVAQCSETVDMCFAEINMDYVDEIRQTQPVMDHRRSELYSLVYNERSPCTDSFMFGPNPVPPSVTFYRSAHSVALVNLKPFVPGHVLVAPIRSVKRLTELSDAETADLFVVAKKVQRMLEGHHNVSSSTVCVQDGVDASQTVEHVHVHILPRRKGDFGGDSDNLYKQLQGHEGQRTAREQKEMEDEAAVYRPLMYQ